MRCFDVAVGYSITTLQNHYSTNYFNNSCKTTSKQSIIIGPSAKYVYGENCK